MNKKIIAVALVLLAFVIVFTACKKEPEYKVDHTVKLDNGDIVEVYEDEDGENFVTNVDGDKIPVTTDKDGFFDNIEDLITETTTKKSDKNDKDKNSTTSTTAPNKDDGKDEPSSTNKNEPSSTNKNEPSSTEKNEPSSTQKPEESTSKQSSVEIGNDKNQGGSIDWDDIVAVP